MSTGLLKALAQVNFLAPLDKCELLDCSNTRHGCKGLHVCITMGIQGS
jgi:hypothetical protein